LFCKDGLVLQSTLLYNNIPFDVEIEIIYI